VAASNQMSATAEELARQAAQLRQQTAYFRLGAAAVATAPGMAAKPAPAKGPKPKPAAGPAAKAAKRRGFALALGGGQVGEEHQFERISA
jgi:methyl-accepting chemotaxis protein